MSFSLWNAIFVFGSHFVFTLSLFLGFLKSCHFIASFAAWQITTNSAAQNITNVSSEFLWVTVLRGMVGFPVQVLTGWNQSVSRVWQELFAVPIFKLKRKYFSSSIFTDTGLRCAFPQNTFYWQISYKMNLSNCLYTIWGVFCQI